MNAMPNDSGPVFGWQWMSAAASSRETSDRWPRNRTRSEIPRASACVSSPSRYAALARPLNPARDPRHPARPVAQPAQRLEEHFMSLQGLQPTGLKDDRGLVRSGQLGADRAPVLDRVAGRRDDREVQDLPRNPRKKGRQGRRRAVAIGHGHVGPGQRGATLDPGGAAERLVQPEDQPPAPRRTTARQSPCIQQL